MDLILVIFQVALPLVAVIAIVVDHALDKAPPGKSPEELDKARSERRTRRVARTFGAAALLLSLVPLGLSYYRDQQKDKENDKRSNEQKAAITDLSNQLGEQSKQLGTQKEELIAESRKVEKTQGNLSDAQKEALKLSSTVLELQNLGIHKLDLMSLDRPFEGIEISYTPTTDEWNQVMKIYQRLVPNIDRETSYYGAPFFATRAGAHWLVDFDEVIMGPQGSKWFPAVSTEQPENKGFEDIIRVASLPLHITWENGVETMLEPWRDNYPSALKLSPTRFVFILRSPVLQLNQASLYSNPNITLRSRRPWTRVRRELTIRSLDRKVKLEQTLKLEWTSSKPSDKRQTRFPTRLYPFASGPHNLNMRFENITR